MRLSLKDRLVRYIRKQNDYVAKGDLQRLVADTTSYTPENVGRRMRELENEGVVEVVYRKGHAFYRAADVPLNDYQKLHNLIQQQ